LARPNYLRNGHAKSQRNNKKNRDFSRASAKSRRQNSGPVRNKGDSEGQEKVGYRGDASNRSRKGAGGEKKKASADSWSVERQDLDFDAVSRVGVGKRRRRIRNSSVTAKGA